ncbi:EamA-like transporter family protein [Methanohalophilus portucalensis FDF-1]|uniref:EamA-like transporter family protein n=4 Tax=Methanohalophilus portucalensis TaxID=39664 RepID=A0A1X7NLU2_9EURY|nr:EamA-like transporter family protein [Methanohalophilus portucalensis FDF-1]
MVDLQALRQAEHGRRIRFGYMWALFCAVLWGLWYIPGTVVWGLAPFVEMYTEVASTSGDSMALIVTAVLITALNAVTVVLALFVWNGVLGNYGEMIRTAKSFHPCSKWFLFASVFGGPVAILGSFMAMGFVGGAFAAVAALLYPVIGAALANVWHGEKISKRAAMGIIVIIAGGITIFGGGVITELQAGSVGWIGYLGGLMAATGWGIEGAVADKGLDVANADVGLHLRFIAELAIWIIIALPLLAIMGYPVFTYAFQVFQPWTILMFVFAGITFGFCYVSWYKSFPLIGVGRGQGIANLYGMFAVISTILFFGDVPQWTVLVGGALCIVGSFIMFSEESLELETLRN